MDKLKPFFQTFGLQFLLIFTFASVLAIILPITPIDETRYLSVAWGMHIHHSYFVPILNGTEYSHKPPFLFWLINLDWSILGINEWSLRFIPAFFAAVNIMLTHHIAMKLWNNKKVAYYASLMLSVAFLYLAWSGLIMFDMILGTWALVAILGIIIASQNCTLKAWLLVGTGLGMGILTKGPVIFVYTLPIALLFPIWKSENALIKKWEWDVGIVFSISVALLITSFWLIPALHQGSGEYCQALLWKQTAGRMVKSFAHRRPFWWYIPLLPLYLLPWCLFPVMWRGTFKRLKNDMPLRFLVLIALSTFLIFSLISGKQIHYLIPIIPITTLFFAKNLIENKGNTKIEILRYLGYFIFFIGGIFSVLSLIFYGLKTIIIIETAPHFIMSAINFISIKSIPILFFTGVIISILGGACLLFQERWKDKQLEALTITIMVLLFLIIPGSYQFTKSFDIKGVSKLIAKKQQEGYTLINFRKYPGQFQFLGRLKHPIVEVKGGKQLQTYFSHHKQDAKRYLIISYSKKHKPPLSKNKDLLLLRAPYRTRELRIWDTPIINELLQKRKVTKVKKH